MEAPAAESHPMPDVSTPFVVHKGCKSCHFHNSFFKNSKSHIQGLGTKVILGPWSSVPLDKEFSQPCLHKKVPAKFGHSEVRLPAPGFAEHVRIFPSLSLSFLRRAFQSIVAWVIRKAENLSF